MPALQDGPRRHRAPDRAGGLPGARPGLSDGSYHVVLPGGPGLSAPAERGGGGGVRRRDRRAVREGGQWAVPVYKGQARVKINPQVSRGNQATVIEQVILLGLDDTSLVGAPPFRKVLAGSLRDLRMPDAVIVDNVRLQKLYPDEAWDELSSRGNTFYQRFLRRQLEMNDHRAIIVGVCEAT